MCCRVELNFGQKGPWFAPPPGYVYIEQVPVQQRVRGMMPPARKADCEVSSNGKLSFAGQLVFIHYQGKLSVNS